jgi:hypothetical protein
VHDKPERLIKKREKQLEQDLNHLINDYLKVHIDGVGIGGQGKDWAIQNKYGSKDLQYLNMNIILREPDVV